MSTLKLYVDRMSQPSRAIIIFCKVNGIEFEEVRIDLAKGQHRLSQFKDINPMGKVPAIAYGRFRLSESHAILSYLACANPTVPDHWYPTDLSMRARINSVLDWHHNNLRRGAASYVLNSTLAPVLGLSLNPKEAARSEKVLTMSLSKIESFWLDGKGKFLVGSFQPSIADLSLVCELMQLQIVDDKDRERILGQYIKVSQWIEDVKKATNPYFDEVSAILYKVKMKLQKTKAKL
ncbi:Glutathione S-transferase T1 [Zostera marina]|uniref:Glutathione S-transferase T1 n=1 Tax=Zostera marina TaxID=29655 RepID=A0A0K9PT01_ZOSMR|nr:Glutathione S-transferase T1 [Zostera marina]